MQIVDISKAAASEQSGPTDGVLDLKKYLAIANRRWTLAVPVGLAVAGLAFAAILFQTPTYSSRVLILISPRQDRIMDTQEVFTGISPDATAIETELEIIRSDILAELVTDQLQLAQNPVWNPSLRDKTFGESVRDVIFAPVRMTRAVLRTLQPGAPSDETAVQDAATQSTINAAVVRRVAASVQAERRRQSYVIQIGITSTNPSQSAQVANAYADAYLNSQLDARFESARRANEWLSERVDALREEVRAKESAVEAYRAENGLIAANGMLLTDQQATELQGSILNARAELAEKQARLRQAQEMISAGGSLDSVASVLNSPAILALRQRESEVARRQSDLESRYFDQHPEVQNVRLERADIQRQIQGEVDLIVQNLENEVEVARSRLGTLESSANQIRSEVLSNNQAQVRLRELERDAQASQAVLESFLGRFQEISNQESLPTTDARVISWAVPSGSPISPTLHNALLVALVLGAIAAAGAALLREMFDDVIRAPEDVTQRVGAPVLAVLPAVTQKALRDLPRDFRDPAGFAARKPMSAFAESLRMLRSAITYSNFDHAPHVVTITSAGAGEGKTTVALALARIAADAGQRVIVVDCDLRRQSLSKFVGKTVTHGLLDVLSGAATLQETILRDNADKVDVLPNKSTTFTPIDVFGSNAMGNLLETLKSQYDLVICDCAPVLAVADTRILARRADATVVIARWGKTPPKALRLAMRELTQSGVRIAGVAVNSISASGAAGEYYGSLYYAKGYQRYYSNA